MDNESITLTEDVDNTYSKFFNECITEEDLTEVDIVDTLKEEYIAHNIFEVYYVTVAVDSPITLRMREKPSKESNTIHSLESGSTLRVISDEDPEWLKVEYDIACDEYMVGYVNKKFVSQPIKL